MPSRELGVKFKATGLRELKRNIGGLREQIKSVVRSNFEWGKSANAARVQAVRASDRTTMSVKEIKNSYTNVREELKKFRAAVKAENYTEAKRIGETALKQTLAIKQAYVNLPKDLQKEVKRYLNELNKVTKEVTEGRPELKSGAKLGLNNLFAPEEIKNIYKLSQAIEQATEKANQKFKKTRKELKDTDKTARKTKQGFTILKGAVANVVSSVVLSGIRALTNGIRGLTGWIFRAGTTAENLKAQLETITGSVESAEAVYQQISQFARTTPFQLDEVTRAYVSLANRGIRPTNQLLAQLGDIASSQGKPLQQIIEAVLDAMTGENERLKEFGIKAQKSGEQVTFTFKGVQKTVAATEGEILQAIVGFSKLDGVMGGMNRRAKTTQGQLSNLTDSLKAVYIRIFNAFKPAFDEIISVANQILAPLSRQENLFKGINNQAIRFRNFLRQNPNLVKTLGKQLNKSVLRVMEAIANSAERVLNYLQQNPDAIEKAGVKLDFMVSTMGSFIKLIDKAVEGWSEIYKLLKLIRAFSSEGSLAQANAREVAARYGVSPEEFNRRVRERERAQPFFKPISKDKIIEQVLQDVILEGRPVETKSVKEEIAEVKTAVAEEIEEVNLGLSETTQQTKNYGGEIEQFVTDLRDRIAQARIETKKLASQLFATNIKNKLRSAIAPGSESFLNSIIDNISSVFDQAQSLIEQSLGLESGKLQLESEERQLELEMQDFIRNLNGATEALANFTGAVNSNDRTNDRSSPPNDRSSSNYFPIPGLNIKNAPISSGYGNRIHPTKGGTRFHPGIDVAVKGGTDVVAVNAGKVSQIKPLADQLQVAVESVNASGQKVTEWFIHLGQKLNVKVGDRVMAGQKLGEVARTTAKSKAISTGDHLDYRVMVGDKWVNPKQFLAKSQAIPKAQLVSNQSNVAPTGNVSGLKNQVIEDSKTNLTLQELLIKTGALADYERNVAVAREQQNRTFNIEALRNDNQVSDTLDRLAELRESSQLPTAAIEQAQQLRQIAAQFRGFKLEGLENIQRFADTVADLQGITKTFPGLIEEIAQSGDENTLKLMPLLRDVLANAEAQLPETTAQLEAMEQAYKDLAAEEKNAIAFEKERGQLRIEKEELDKRSQANQVKLNIATQRGTSELRRQNEILVEQTRLNDQILAIREKYGDSPDAEELIQLERQQSRINIENINRDALDRDTAFEQQLLDLNSGIASGRGGLLSNLGFDLESNRVQRENAIAQENFRYQQQLTELERQYGAEPDKLAQLKQRAEELNQVNLEGIQQQFKTLGNIIRGNAQQALSDFFFNWFRDISNGKELFLGFVRTILEGIARIAAQRLASGLLGSIFGGVGRAVAPATTSLNFGSGFSAFTAKYGATVPDQEIDNFSKGGRIVPKQISDRLKQISPNIKNGFRKEGAKGVLGIFTPGEEILSIKTGEAPIYQGLKAKLGRDPLGKLFAGNFDLGGTIGKLQGLDIEQNLLSSLAVDVPEVNVRAIAEPQRNRQPVNQKVINVSAQIVTPDADSFRKSEYQTQQDLAQFLIRGS